MNKKITPTIFLVSHFDGHFDTYDYFIPVRAFRLEKDAKEFVKKQNNKGEWEIDAVLE